LELDDPPLSAADEELVDKWLAEHQAKTTSSVQLDDIKRRLQL